MTTKRKLTFAGMLIAFCLLLCCVFGFLFSTTGGNTAYAYSSSTKYKLDLTATGTSGIYIYVSGVTGSGTVSDGAAFNFAPNRVDVVLTKKTELGRYTYTRYVKDFALTGPVTYSSADKQKNSSKSSEKTVTYTLPTLTNGSYTLTMTTGQDYSGMIGDASTKVTFNFIVDKNRPTISGASVSTTGKYTNKAFTVTASDLLSGIDKLYWKAPTASIYSSTTAISKTISAGSANGRYTFYAVDKAGNQSSYYYVYYDNVVPTGTIKETSGTLSSGSYTNKAFSYSATDSGSGINYLQYKKPGSSTWTSYTSGTTIPATSTNGWYYFRAYDNAGNVSAESSVCLDTAVPTGTVYKETTSVSSGSSVKGVYIKLIATDSLSGVANCYVKAPGETSYKSYTSNSPLTTEGVYQFYIVDRAGNQSSTYSIALDNTAPTGMVYGGTTEKPSGSIVNSSYIKFIGYGLIYKNGEAYYEPQKYPKDEIVYIPEYGFPEREYDQVHEGDLISKYTRQDLIDITCSETLASELFDELTWQHPESLWNEWCSDSDKNGYWIEAQWAYEKVYLPEFAADVDRHGQEPVCSEEFRDNEWGDKECRSYFLRRLVDMAFVSKEDMGKIMKNMEAGIV